MGKTVINESVLRKIIAESVKEVLNERASDWIGSGLVDYQGTGSKESSDRMKKVREKSFKYNDGFNPMHNHPGKGHFKKNGNGETTKYELNKSNFEGTLDKFGVGGDNGAVTFYGRYNKLLDDVNKFIDRIRTYNDENLNSLAKKLDKALWEWDKEVYDYRDKKSNPQN